MQSRNRMRTYIEYLLRPGDKEVIELMFAEDMYPANVRMGCVILAFEALMITVSLVRAGSVAGIRSQIYFAMYVALFLITLGFLCLLVGLHRHKPESVSRQINLAFGYSIFLCAWSCIITLLDQHSGTNLNVYCYMFMAMAVFSMLRPCQSIVMFGSGFLALNGLAQVLQNNPVFFRAPLNTYSLLLNSLFVTLLTIIISITLYRYRIIKKHDRMLIERQYDKISEINQKLNDLAMTDQLTKVGNRRFLDEKMQELQREEGNREKTGIATGMMLDIDFFKQYNDNYGHQAGDVCLKKIAEIMRDFAEDEDGFVVRYGGEEFFLCLPSCQNPLEKAEELRQKIVDRKLVRGDLPWGHVTVSIGVDVEQDWTVIGQDGFLRRCDEALYDAKNTGRNKVCLYQKKDII